MYALDAGVAGLGNAGQGRPRSNGSGDRAAQGGDASEAGLAVLETQLATHEALSAEELSLAAAIDVRGDSVASARTLYDALAQRLKR